MSWLDSAKAQAERFWSKVGKGEPGECWPWLAGIDKDGYGKFSVTLPAVNGKNPQKHVRAHRLAFVLTYGELPGLLRHCCDTPGCCNPEHLLAGTQADNRRDCVERGRQPRGEASAKAKLRAEDVVVIRESRGRVTAAKLAEIYGVCSATIGHIWSGRNWA